MSQTKRKQWLVRWLGVLIIAPGVALGVSAGSAAGWFQLLEWATLDQFFRQRPSEPREERIAIVTIDEDDLNYVKQWPMADGTLAKLLKNIREQKPKAIGIDIYRDLKVEPGHEELVEVFKSTPNLIGIEKTAGNAIAPPPALQELGQVGASDVVLDADGKVRRGLIIVGNNKGEIREGLGVKTALMYMFDQGVELELVDQEQKIYGLGKAKFVPLTGKEGEYEKEETAGYQILVNYRGELASFPHISLTEVLENEIPPGMMKDNIVLVGAIAPSLNDFFQTPYSTSIMTVSELTPGVVVHANIASQILSSALEGRPMLRAWTKSWHWLAIVILSGASATLGSVGLRQRKAWVAIIIMGVGIVIISYIAFLNGWWLPTFTPLLTVTSSAVLSIGYTLWTNLMLSYQKLEDYAHTLEDKVKERTAELADANQQISALNEKLTEENLRLSAELEVAYKIQQMVLPKESEMEAIADLDIAGFMEPADEVGGDYYDVLLSNDGKVKIGIGDVTGHGLESGVLMLMVQTAIRTLQQCNVTDPVQFFDVLNRTIYANLERMNSDKNLTLALLDYNDGKVVVSGQHEEAIVLRSDGEMELIDTMDLGFPIGLDEEIADFVAQKEVELNSGDVVVVYTDGITEAEDLNGVQYGLERLCQVLENHRHENAKKIEELVIADLREHIGKQKVFDDITLLVFKQK